METSKGTPVTTKTVAENETRDEQGLHLKGLDRVLVGRCKALAFAQGQTLKDWVVERLEEAVGRLEVAGKDGGDGRRTRRA